MARNGNSRNGRGWSDTRPHDEFLGLCAISTTGELSEAEQSKLQEHLVTCSDCRQALAEFEAAADVGAPLLASELNTANWRQGTIAPAPIEEPTEVATTGSNEPAPESDDCLHSAQVNWNYGWLSLAAAVLLVIALSISSYQTGRRRAPGTAQVAPASVEAKMDALERQLSDAGHDREILRTQLTQQDQTIQELQRRIESESAALNEARHAQVSLRRSLQDALSEKQQMAQRQANVSQSLDVAQESLHNAQSELDSLQQKQREDELLDGSLQAQIRDLNGQLRMSQQTVNRQQDLLGEDRDIRDLMGARDLYIAEVYDVARDGATRKPYGRVFYTKGRSLVFYAYDLQQQPGVRNASTFQAWGQNGPDRQQALSLGIFYQDGLTKKRWVLKFDDPNALEQINAVFVTVEPHGGSHKPSGKPLLFASLKIEPNHP